MAPIIGKGRIEAFSDGVIAIIITIMVLELKVPHGTGFADLLPVAPVLLSYVLSFAYVGIYWNNHHHLFQAARGVTGPIMWANLHLLFWMSLIPFVTAWAGEHPLAPLPVALYGAVLLLCSIAFLILAAALHPRGRDSWKDRKNLVSIGLYASAAGLALWYAPAASALHVVIAALWLRPRAMQ